MVAVGHMALAVSWGAHCHMVVVAVVGTLVVAAAGSDVIFVGMLVVTGVAGHQEVV